MEILNTREKALGIWLLVFLIFLLSKPSTRKSVASLIKSVFASSVTVIFISIFLYTSTIVYLLNLLGLWDVTQLKNSILWLLTVGFLSIGDVTDKNKSNYFKDTVLKVFQFTTILEFLVGLYTFSLTTELIIIPLAILVTLMIAVGKSDEKFKPAISFLNGMLAIGGIVIIGYTIYHIITGFSLFESRGTLTEFLIPPVLSLLFLPYLYVLSLIVSMEDVFVVLKRRIADKALLRYAKWQALIHIHFNKTELKRWQQIMLATNAKSRLDIQHTFVILKQSKGYEKNPPNIPFADGWSPYLAKDFLISEGISTGFYQSLYQNEWQATSQTINLENSAFSSDVIYYVRGVQSKAVKLILKMNVFFPGKAELSNQKFLSLSKTLFAASLSEVMPKKIQDSISNGINITCIIKGKRISLTKDIWVGHKFNGYDIALTIKNINDNL